MMAGAVAEKFSQHTGKRAGVCRAVSEMNSHEVLDRFGGESFDPLASCLLSQGVKEQTQLKLVILHRLFRKLASHLKMSQICVEEPCVGLHDAFRLWRREGFDVD